MSSNGFCDFAFQQAKDKVQFTPGETKDKVQINKPVL